MDKALLIIDVQNDYFEGGCAELVEPLEALANVEKALALFRTAGLPVIHVQHISTRLGAGFFLPDTVGAAIHSHIAPRDGEPVVVKHAPNSFYQTGLAELLKEKAVDELVVCGMMSHMCVDTTVRACKDLGLTVTLLHDACATKDLIWNGEMIPARTVHAAFMASLNGMFASVIATDDLFCSALSALPIP